MTFEDLASSLTLDANDYVSGANEAEQASEGLADSTDEVESGMSQLSGVAAGAAIAGVGAAAQGALDSTQPLRESLGRTSQNMGISRDEAEELATSMSDATFPLDDVEQSMSNLAAMTDTPEQMEETALAADNIADATGTSASQITENLAPAVNGLDGNLDGLIENQDAFTLAAQDSTLSIEDIGNTLQKLDFQELEEMGLTADETAGLMSQFADETGYSGRQLESNFNQAVDGADGDLGQLHEELGLGEDALDEWNGKVEDNAGVTDEYAESANESLSTMDTMRSIVDDLTLRFSSFIEPVEALAPVLMGLGGTIAAVSASGVTASGTLATLTTAIGAIGAPIAVAVAAVAGLAVAFNEDFAGIRTQTMRVVDVFRDELQPVFNWFSSDGEPLINTIRDAVMGFVEAATPYVETFIELVADNLIVIIQEGARIFGEVFELMSQAVGDFIEFAEPYLMEFFDWFAGIYEQYLAPAQADLVDLFDVVQLRINQFVDIVGPYVEGFADTVIAAFQYIQEIVDPLIDAHLDNIIELFSFAIDTIVTVVEGFVDTVTSAISIFLSVLEGDFDEAWSQIVGLVTRNIDRIVSIVSGFVETATTMFTNLIEGIIGIFQNLYDTIVGNSIIPDLVSDVIGYVEDLYTDFTNEVEELVDSVIGFFEDLYDDVTEWVSDLMSDILETITETDVKGAVFDILEEAYSWLTGTAAGQFLDAGEGLIDALVSGIKDAPSSVKDAVSGVVGEAREYLPFSDAKEGPLSDLTASGESIPKTLAEGAESGMGTLEGTMDGMPSPPSRIESSGGSSRTQSGGITQRDLERAMDSADRTDELVDKLDSMISLLSSLDSGDVKQKDVLKALDVANDRRSGRDPLA